MSDPAYQCLGDCPAGFIAVGVSYAGVAMTTFERSGNMFFRDPILRFLCKMGILFQIEFRAPFEKLLYEFRSLTNDQIDNFFVTDSTSGLECIGYM